MPDLHRRYLIAPAGEVLARQAEIARTGRCVLAVRTLEALLPASLRGLSGVAGVACEAESDCRDAGAATHRLGQKSEAVKRIGRGSG